MHIYYGHRNDSSPLDGGVEQKHHSIAMESGVKAKREVPDLELGEGLVLQDVEQVVGLQGPHSEGVLVGVLGHNLSVELIEFYKVRPFKYEVAKQVLVVLFIIALG
jgi:hypothetical protein